MTRPSLWAGLAPAGVGQRKPHHYREMARAAWENRDSLRYAWRILSRGTCDGCALGTAGLHDWTISGVHLCMVRLEMMRLNTAPPLDPERLSRVEGLASLSSRGLRALGRLPCPMLRRAGEAGFRRISWEEAYEAAAAAIRAADPRRVAFYLTSRGILNEHYYAVQKAARFLGTNHVDNSARLCHAASTTGMKETLGYGATTCSYADWNGTDLIVFFGSNAANNEPVTMKYLYEARRSGTRVALVNPYEEPGMKRYWVPSAAESALFGTRMCDELYPVDTGGDLAFLTGVFRVLCAEGWLDREFIARATDGFERAREAAEAIPWEELERSSGTTREEMRRFAATLRAARNAVFVWSMGLTQHRHGTDTIRALVNVGLARGYLGREKNGLMPIRGHSGVQGGAEVGAVPAFDAAARRRLEELWGFPVPEWRGHSASEQLAAAARGELDVFWIVGGNFLETLPDPPGVAAALETAATRIHHDIVVTTQMLVPAREAVLLLPATTRYETPGGGTETTTERRIVFTPEIPGPRLAHARCEWEVVAEVARRARPGEADRLRIESSAQLREEIERAFPLYEGVGKLRKFGDNIQWGGPRLFSGGRFATPDGRAHFSPVRLPPSAGAGLRLSTRRGKQFNSMVQRDEDPLTGAGREDLLISAEDAARRGLREGEEVEVRSASGRMRARVRVAPIKPGNVQAHWPEALTLLPGDSLDPESLEPDYNTTVEVAPLTQS